jgi:cytoskeletal protein CcmA (bactofilin family)
MFRGGKSKMPKIDTLIGHNTVLHGDVRYKGGLHVDGTIKGNVFADDDADSVLSVSERGIIEGDVHVYTVVLNGKVMGDVHALEKIELAPNARVIGNVYYNLIEMAMGSEVNGNLVHRMEKRAEAGASGEGGAELPAQ